MDLLILPSKLEAFGQIASEAILCGTPVIGFNKTGLDDIIVHKNGWLANKFKVDQLIKGIEFLLKKKNKKLIRKSILGKFSEKKIAKEYINIYKQRINEKINLILKLLTNLEKKIIFLILLMVLVHY